MATKVHNGHAGCSLGKVSLIQSLVFDLLRCYVTGIQLRDWKTGVKQDCIKPKGAGNGVYSMVHKVSMTGTFCRVSFYPNGANDYLMNSSADLVKTNP